MTNKIKLILLLFLLISAESNFESTKDELRYLFNNCLFYDLGLKGIQNREALCTPFENFLKEKDISPEDYQKAIKIKENFAQTLKRGGAELTEKDIKNIEKDIKNMKKFLQLSLKKEHMKFEAISNKQDGAINTFILMTGSSILKKRLRGAALTAEELHEWGRGIDTIFKMIEKKQKAIQKGILNLPRKKAILNLPRMRQKATLNLQRMSVNFYSLLASFMTWA